MQNNTSKMVALLGKIRKHMNGAVLDTFRYYGARYGMNYGVAIHSIRELAREIGCDDSLSRFLFRQQVRELQIIALWIADAEQTDRASLEFWAAGIVNSELAEQAAQALLCRIESIDYLLEEWTNSENELLAYAALLAASRSDKVSAESTQRAVVQTVEHFVDNHLAAQGVVRLLGAQIVKNRDKVAEILSLLPENSTAAAVREEISWQLEY